MRTLTLNPSTPYSDLRFLSLSYSCVLSLHWHHQSARLQSAGRENEASALMFGAEEPVEVGRGLCLTHPSPRGRQGQQE